MTSRYEVKRFPALQAFMGDWEYYVTTLPFGEAAKRIRFAGELVPSPQNMNSWIQREIIPERGKKIAEYLINQEQRLFPSLVIGVLMGEPTWYEISLDDDPSHTYASKGVGFTEHLGILELDGTERLYAIDGQHRIAGIQEALRQLSESGDIEAYNRLSQETISVIFVSADTEIEGQLERVRRLFTTLNKKARPVSLPERIALDEDDPAAIVTRWLATDYDGLNREVPRTNDRPGISLIQMGTTNEIQPRNRHSITTVVTLYTFVDKVFRRELSALRRGYSGNRPADHELNDLYKRAVEIWELMATSFPPIANVLGSDPREGRAGLYRDENGGHILFRPIGLQAFAGALGVLRARKVSIERATRGLSDVPTEISEVPWENVVWNPNTGRIINGNRPVSEALFLYMVGHTPRTRRFDLARRYRDLCDNPADIPLMDVPILQIAG